MKEWREFEKLVEKIEKTLSPTSAIVKSPNFLVDKVTGEEREVDVTIYNDLGSASILIAIECRNRKSIQDVQWIEQIKTKHDNLGIAKTIAVAKKGFTKQAINKAKFLNIELRTFDEINEDIINNWNQSFIIEAINLSYQLESLNFILEGKHGGPIADIRIEKSIFQTILVTIEDKEYSLDKFLSPDKMISIFKNSKELDKEKVKIVCSAKLPKNTFVNTDKGNLPVKEISFSILVWQNKNLLSADSMHVYRDIVSNDVHQLVDYDLGSFFDEEIRLEVYKKYTNP